MCIGMPTWSALYINGSFLRFFLAVFNQNIIIVPNSDRMSTGNFIHLIDVDLIGFCFSEHEHKSG